MVFSEVLNLFLRMFQISLLMILLFSSDGEVVKSRVNFCGLERKVCIFKCDFLVLVLDKVEW